MQLNPMATAFLRTTAAYIIERKAAEGVASFNSPVRLVVDNWAAYYHPGVIDSLRLLHTISVRSHPFESTFLADRGAR
jgi:hypothetical protein